MVSTAPNNYNRGKIQAYSHYTAHHTSSSAPPSIQRFLKITQAKWWLWFYVYVEKGWYYTAPENKAVQELV